MEVEHILLTKIGHGNHYSFYEKNLKTLLLYNPDL